MALESRCLLATMVLVLAANAADASAEAAWRSGLSWARSLGSSSLTDAQNLETTMASEVPERIARFYLMTSNGQVQGLQQLLYEDLGTINESAFDPKLETRVLIHGYLANRRTRWVRALTKELLRRGDSNLIVVDWSGLTGSSTVYPVAVARTKLVGRAISKLIQAFGNATGVEPDKFHLIGHSLGAHAAGYAGSFTPGLGRITGLDPAGPGFEYAGPTERLDPSDATFVDVIHTDAPSFMDMLRGNAGFGLSTAVGHADFYPNGGRSQPACQRALSETTVWDYVTCDHEIATDYFLQSVRRDCQFVGFQCPSYWAYSAGACNSVISGPRQTNTMGLGATKPASGSVTYYLTTLSSPPYCASTTAATSTAASSRFTAPATMTDGGSA